MKLLMSRHMMGVLQLVVTKACTCSFYVMHHHKHVCNREINFTGTGTKVIYMSLPSAVNVTSGNIMSTLSGKYKVQIVTSLSGTADANILPI